MIEFVKIIVIFSNFRYISGVILPRKYSLIKVFKNRFFIILEIDAHTNQQLQTSLFVIYYIVNIMRSARNTNTTTIDEENLEREKGKEPQVGSMFNWPEYISN